MVNASFRLVTEKPIMVMRPADRGPKDALKRCRPSWGRKAVSNVSQTLCSLRERPKDEGVPQRGEGSQLAQGGSSEERSTVTEL